MSARVLLEAHTHTKESSHCGKIAAEDLVHMLKESGYGAAVITDHFLPGERQDAKARDAFLTGFRAAKAAGDACGLVVLPGMEMRFKDRPEDYLVYGMEEADFAELPDDACEMGLQQFFDYANPKGFRIYQAHPFRKKHLPAHTSFIHGMETFNGNPRHDSQNRMAAKFATLHSLHTIAGSDVHRQGDTGIAGLLVPEEALTPKGFAEWLAVTPHPRVQHQEQPVNGIRYLVGAVPAVWMLEGLYAGAGWTSYTVNMAESMNGIMGSSRLVTAWDDTALVGMARAISDGHTIAYVQDVLVAGAFQRRGIGYELMRRVLYPYRHVRQTVLVTDDTPSTRAFYRACGFESIADIGCAGHIRFGH